MKPQLTAKAARILREDRRNRLAQINQSNAWQHKAIQNPDLLQRAFEKLTGMKLE